MVFTLGDCPKYPLGGEVCLLSEEVSQLERREGGKSDIKLLHSCPPRASSSRGLGRQCGLAFQAS